MRRLLWHIGGRSLAFVVRLLPLRHRFSAAILAARILQPLFRVSGAYAERLKLRTDGLPETSLDFVVMMLTRHDVAFDPRIEVSGLEHVPDASTKGATLIVSPHTMLSVLILPLLIDRGVTPSFTAADPAMKIPGRRSGANQIIPTRTFFVTVRELFAAGRIVISMIDRDVAERRTRAVTTSRGEHMISTALLEVALREGARILFFTTRLDPQWNVRMSFVEGSRGDVTDVNELADRFGAFLERHVYAPLEPLTGLRKNTAVNATANTM